MSSSAKKRPRRDKEPKGEKMEEEECTTWECTVCTFINKFEAFKCDICDTRKGTSTRKPRLNSTVVQQHQIVHDFVVEQSRAVPPCRRPTRTHSPDGDGSVSSSRADSPNSFPSSPVPSSSRCPPTLSGIDRESARTLAVTVRGVTVVITDFKPLHKVIATATGEA